MQCGRNFRFCDDRLVNELNSMFTMITVVVVVVVDQGLFDLDVACEVCILEIFSKYFFVFCFYAYILFYRLIYFSEALNCDLKDVLTLSALNDFEHF